MTLSKPFTYASPYGLPQIPLGLRYTQIMSTINFVLQLAGPVSPSFAPAYPVQICRMDDTGLQVVVQVLDGNGNPVDLRSASTKVIKFLLPGEETFDVNASLYTNGMDGKLYATTTTTAPPLDQTGIWYVQARVASGAQNSLSTSWGQFKVMSNIDNS